MYHVYVGRNGNFPNWVLPFERDGLFWCDMDVGLWLAAKIVMGFSFFAMVFLNQVGCARYVGILAPAKSLSGPLTRDRQHYSCGIPI